eukprot:152074_1
MSSFLLFLVYVLQLSIIKHSKAASSFTIYVNASNVSSIKIWNPWTTENSADYTNIWDNTAYIDKTNPTIKEQYPFFSHQKFAYGTGGCYKGYTDPNNKTCKSHFDLLQDPSNPNSPYNFSQLHIAIDNVIKMGLKPYIVAGLIPIAYSNNATLSDAKDLNELPPSNYTQYGDYIYSLAKYLLNIYGATEIKEWWFGVITEYNNYGHFDDVYDFNATMMEYFKIYDYTECNLKKALGANNFILGAHGCCRNGQNPTKAWDPDLLLKHIANEENYCTSVTGDTKMDFYSSSFYELGPGNPGDQSMFDTHICSMHDAVKKYGLQDKVRNIAIDEGRILADENGAPLLGRAVGATYQASWDSLLFYNMIRCNITRFTRWGVDTNGLGTYVSTENQHVSTVQPVSANVIRLTYKMKGDYKLNMNVTMKNDKNGYQKVDADNNTQIVNGIASLSENGRVTVFVFNHNSKVNSTKTANITINVCNVKSINGDGKICNITEWMIDDNHSQFWNIYWNDVVENNITSFCGYPNRSNQGEELCFEDLKEREYIQSRNSVYQNASKLVSKSYQIEYKVNECMEITQQMIPSHGVRLFEVSC